MGNVIEHTHTQGLVMSYESIRVKIKRLLSNLRIKDEDIITNIVNDIWMILSSKLYTTVPYALLKKITREKVIDYFRSLKTFKNPEVSLPEGLCFKDNLEQNNCAIILLRKALSKLSKNKQDILRKHYYEDKSFLAIAEKLEIPKGTVKRQIFRTKKELAIEILSLIVSEQIESLSDEEKNLIRQYAIEKKSIRNIAKVFNIPDTLCKIKINTIKENLLSIYNLDKIDIALKEKNDSYPS